MISTESRIKRNGRVDSALKCSAPVSPDFAINGELTAANAFVVYGECPQLVESQRLKTKNKQNKTHAHTKQHTYTILHLLNEIWLTGAFWSSSFTDSEYRSNNSVRQASVSGECRGQVLTLISFFFRGKSWKYRRFHSKTVFLLTISFHAM